MEFFTAIIGVVIFIYCFKEYLKEKNGEESTLLNGGISDICYYYDIQ